MSPEQRQLEAAIAALEAQRTVLGDVVVDSLLAPARAKLGALSVPAAPAPDPAQPLKQVTILFLDGVGSTRLSQHLDPEGISAVMDDALKRGTAVVVAHRGKVLQYAGDNILAAFGADLSAEDDADRAVHCGLALLELGKTLGSEVQATLGHAGFNVRVGIHTGGVLLGGGVDADGSIRGIAVNITARMEQTAPAGALRISHDTYAQVRGLFEVDAQEPLAVKGVDAPLWQGDETRALTLARAALDIAAAAQAREEEVFAGLTLGDAEQALGRLAVARQAYAQAWARALEIDDHKQHDASAGLARVALAQGDAAAAVAALQPVLDHLAAGGTLDGTEYPRQIELTCHQALARVGDPRAADWLARAHAALMAQAAAINDSTLRQGFLHHIPHHREIVAFWAQRDGGAAGGAAGAAADG